MTNDLSDRMLDAVLVGARMVPPPPPGALAAGRAEVDAAIGHACDEVAARRVRRRRTGVLAGVAAAAAVAVVLGPATGGSPGGANAAAAVLTAAGDSAASQYGGWPHARYWHTSSTYVRDGRTSSREIWIPQRGDSVLRDPGVDAGTVAVLNPDPLTFFGPGISWAQLYALPTDPTALAAALRRYDRGQGRNPDQQLFSTVGELLGESPAPPALRRALYRVAAAVPGVVATGPVTDREGRRGQGVSRDGETLVIDSSTGQLLEDRQGRGYVWTYRSQGPASTAPNPDPPGAATSR